MINQSSYPDQENPEKILVQILITKMTQRRGVHTDSFFRVDTTLHHLLIWTWIINLPLLLSRKKNKEKEKSAAHERSWSTSFEIPSFFSWGTQTQVISIIEQLVILKYFWVCASSLVPLFCFFVFFDIKSLLIFSSSLLPSSVIYNFYK